MMPCAVQLDLRRQHRHWKRATSFLMRGGGLAFEVLGFPAKSDGTGKNSVKIECSNGSTIKRLCR